MRDSDVKTSKRILTYDEIVLTPTGENGERMVDVRTYDPAILAEYEQFDMLPYTGDVIFVRDSVAHRLAAANADLAGSGLRLKVVYGYRHPEIQRKYFLERRATLREESPTISEEELDRLTHSFTAVPDVAGHPTGGAVDCTLVTATDGEIDMGTKIDFSDSRIQAFSDGLSETQTKNRWILRDALMEQDFAPFNGEWWHFSYGDREWACFYREPSALYSSLDLRTQV